MDYIGFGTMNGKDGKPFKTRDGGVMRLEYLLKEVEDAVYDKIMENRTVEEAEARKTAKIIGLAAIKYGDLSNQASKDYVFDIERFTSFEGNTGPYILYTMVRIKSILNRYEESHPAIESFVAADEREFTKSEVDLMLTASRFADTIERGAEELAPHKICQYIYELANAFNSFYHENKIVGEEDQKKQAQWISLITLTLRILEVCIDLLGFEAPDRM